MYDNINVLHDIIENIGGSKIPGDNHGERLPVFCSTGFHFVGFRLGPCGASNLDPAFEEKVYDVSTHKACGTCDENMAEGRVVPLSGLDLLRLKGVALTEEQATLYCSSM